MAKTLGDIKSTVRGLLKETTARFWSDNELKNFINDACMRIARDIRLPKKSITGNLSANDTYFTVPNDFLSIDDELGISLNIGGTLHQLAPKRPTDIGRETLLKASAGIPEYYYIKDVDKIAFDCPLESSATYTLNYIYVPTTMSNDGDSNEISTFAYWAIIWWTLTMALIKDKDERYMNFLQFYGIEVEGLKTYAAEMINYDYRLTPQVK